MNINILGGAPPGLVLHVPIDGGREPLGEIGVGRPPAQLAPELRAVDGVAAVVAGAVGDPVEVIGVLSQRLGSVEKVGVEPDPKRVGPASWNLEYG